MQKVDMPLAPKHEHGFQSPIGDEKNPKRQELNCLLHSKGGKFGTKAFQCLKSPRARCLKLHKEERFPEETKAKISASTKGKPRPERRGVAAHNKGKPMSEEQKAKLSEIKKGGKLSEEQKTKMSASQKKRHAEAGGDAVSPEGRRRIGEARKGHVKSPETLRKMSLAMQGRPSPMEGQKHTPEALEKMSKKKLEEWANLSEEERAKRLKRLQDSNQDIIVSKIENFYAQSLDAQGITYERQKHIGWYRVDFYIPSENRIVEVAGCYWHCCEQCGHADKHPGFREADEKRYAYLRRKGYIVDVVWEHDFPSRLRH